MSKAEGTSNQYSSRGIGIPVGGAIGGGDDFAQRIAKPYSPRPFRSQGGFEGSADSNFSMRLGRHNIEDIDPHEETFNFDNIQSDKIAGPRKLPRGFKLHKNAHYNLTNMKDFEELGDHAIASAALQFESNLRDFLDILEEEQPENDKLRADEFSGAGAIAGYTLPLGSGSSRTKDFYKKMVKAAGGSFVKDPTKLNKST